MRKSVIVNFHKVDDPIWFEKEISSLKSKYNIVDIYELEEILRSGKKLKNICHITFDDGDQTFYKIAFPVLVKHKVPVSHFVSPKIILERSNFWFQESEDYNQSEMKDILISELNLEAEKIAPIPFGTILKCLTIDQIHQMIQKYQEKTTTSAKGPQNMSLEELKEVEASGLVTLGAHTMNHPILKNEPDDSSRTEITESIKGLEKILGHPIHHFAYPNGIPEMDFSEREIRCLKENNIRIAFSTEPRHLKSGDNFHSLPRMGLSPRNPMNQIKLRLGSKWELVRSLFTKSALDVRNKVYEMNS